MPERKSKLTLTVDAGTVEKAKRLGINISDLTEKVLRGFVFDPKDESKPALMDNYKAMFDAMIPLLKEYDTSVCVAASYAADDKYQWQETVHLQPEGGFWAEPEEVTLTFDQLTKNTVFLDPNEILQNFIGSLEKGKAKRRERLESLAVARRLIEAIVKIESESGRAKGPRTSQTRSPKRRKHARR